MTDKTIPEKLLVKPGQKFRIINVPQEISTLFSELPQGASFALKDEPADVVLIFLDSMNELKNIMPIDSKQLQPHGIPWLAYPKKTSDIKTDLDRDIIWRYLQSIGWTGVAMISINETWSGFRMKKAS
jgi:hypothetical protein